MGTSLRITGVVVFLIGINLAAPKVARITGFFGSWAADACTVHSFVNLESSKNNVPGMKHRTCQMESDKEYQPPNYGTPNSQHGSGTR
jgi:hypothetical protein